MCRELYCINPAGDCITNSIPAAEGTPCTTSGIDDGVGDMQVTHFLFDQPYAFAKYYNCKRKLLHVGKIAVLTLSDTLKYFKDKGFAKSKI